MTRRDGGEGSIFRRSDGRWQASLQVDGTRRTVYGRTEREARQRLAELRQQVARQGALPDPGKRTVNDLLDTWLEVSAPTWKARTLEDRRQLCDAHIRPTLGGVRLSKLTPDRLQRLYSQLQKQGKTRTAQKVHVVLHRALRLAVLWGWLLSSPADRVLRPQHRTRRKEIWTPGELQTFLEGAREHWLFPLWAVAIASGARLGELTALTWADVDLAAGTITIAKTLTRAGGQWVIQPPKTKGSERTLTLPPQSVAALRRQRARQAACRLRAGAAWHDASLVFTGEHGQPLNRSVVAHALRRECQRLGLPEVSPHGLRHLSASLLLDAGLPLPQVAARLGHANSQITASIYAHTVGRRDDAAAEAIGKAMQRL